MTYRDMVVRAGARAAPDSARPPPRARLYIHVHTHGFDRSSYLDPACSSRSSARPARRLELTARAEEAGLLRVRRHQGSPAAGRRPAGDHFVQPYVRAPSGAARVPTLQAACVNLDDAAPAVSRLASSSWWCSRPETVARGSGIAVALVAASECGNWPSHHGVYILGFLFIVYVTAIYRIVVVAPTD